MIEKARKFQKNMYFCFIDYAKALDCVDHNELWKALKEMGIPDHLTSLLRNLYVGQEAIVWNNGLVQDRERSTTGLSTVPVCLIDMLSTSREMLDWMSYKLESRQAGETSTTSGMRMIPLHWQKAKIN